MKIISFALLAFLVRPPQAFAFKDKSVGVGIGYYSQNVMNKVSKDDAGSTGFLGEPNYPLNLKYDRAFSSTWFFAPQFSYTISPRSTAGSTAKVTLTHLSFLLGKNFNATGATWDWYVGPGILQEVIKGNGGTTVMNNGSSTAVFAIPGSSSTVNKVTLNLGSSVAFGSNRLGLEFIFENAFSSTKRSQSLMFSYSYLLAGGKSRSSGGKK